jgi:integrase
MSHHDHIPHDDINELFAAIHPRFGAVATPLAAALTLHLYTGLRPDEVGALKTRDMNLRG